MMGSGMPLDYEKMLALKIPAVEQSYGPKDCMLYALGLGLGQDPLNADELAFVYEKNLKVLPTFALMQGYSAYWLRHPELGVTWTKVVHGEQGVVLHQPVAPQGTVIGRTRIVDVVDKGEGKGALVYSERQVSDKQTGRLLATLAQTTFCRADGGFGGPKDRTEDRTKRDTTPHALPQRAPDGVCDFSTRPEMALIYRLSGDVNALHVDPEFAKAAGYPRPILHGLATFGVAGHALLKAVCGYDPARLTAIAGRFSAPVFPGETIRTEFWRDGGVVSFRARVMERDVIAISNGRAEVKAR
jgi:acyl dehydratase